MDYLKLFQTHEEYEAFVSGGTMVKPNVSHCIQENDVHYNAIPDPYNGHEYVDLGLPSGTKWAAMNVGATSVTDYGNYYMYGMGSKTYDSADTPYAGIENPLALSADTAAQEWGGDWHMPTNVQIEELIANTTYQWVENYQGSGINGYLFTASNGKSVFFPACGTWFEGGSLMNVGSDGFYWGSSPDNSYTAYGLYFFDGFIDASSTGRLNGSSVRPVVD